MTMDQVNSWSVGEETYCICSVERALRPAAHYEWSQLQVWWSYYKKHFYCDLLQNDNQHSWLSLPTIEKNRNNKLPARVLLENVNIKNINILILPQPAKMGIGVLHLMKQILFATIIQLHNFIKFQTSIIQHNHDPNKQENNNEE